jgi:hypothetical protein
MGCEGQRKLFNIAKSLETISLKVLLNELNKQLLKKKLRVISTKIRRSRNATDFNPFSFK